MVTSRDIFWPWGCLGGGAACIQWVETQDSLHNRDWTCLKPCYSQDRHTLIYPSNRRAFSRLFVFYIYLLYLTYTFLGMFYIRKQVSTSIQPGCVWYAFHLLKTLYTCEISMLIQNLTKNLELRTLTLTFFFFLRKTHNESCESWPRAYRNMHGSVLDCLYFKVVTILGYIYINHIVACEKQSSAIFKVKEDSILNF